MRNVVRPQGRVPWLGRLLLPFALLLGSLAAPAHAAAYSAKTSMSDACHEEITQRALIRARDVLGSIDRVSASDNELALIEDVPFNLWAQLRDLGAASLVLGNRNVDFRGHEQGDLDQLAPLHGAPERQREHCLRTGAQDDPEGSQQALQSCRDFIRQKIAAALGGMDATGSVNASARTRIEVALDLRGSVHAELPTYHVEMGQALHTIQDGFSHTFRSDNHLEVVTVLNYVEYAEDTLDSRLDGPAHRSPLDDCRGLDTLRSERLEVATRASTEFLLATLDPDLALVDRQAEVETLLDRYFTHREGCDASNAWCDAPEASYANQPAGCRFVAAGSPEGAHAGMWSMLALSIASWRARRRRFRGPRPSRCRKGASGLFALLGLVTFGANARAEQPDNSAQPDPRTEPLAARAVAEEDSRIEAPAGIPFGVAISSSASLENAALAAALGARYRLNEHWSFGLDAEYNPWYAQGTSRFRPGVASAFASTILRFPMRFERTNLRSTLQLGGTRMLFDLYGVPEGSMGPYVGISLLGLDFEIGRQIYLVLDPAHIAVPIPQLTGAPFAYAQYRITLGFQFGA